MLSYWLIYVSRALLKQCRCLDILFLLGIYEQQNNDSVILNNLHRINIRCYLVTYILLVSKKKCHLLHTEVSLHHLCNGLENPSSKNCPEGNDSSILVSDISNISVLCVRLDNQTLH